MKPLKKLRLTERDALCVWHPYTQAETAPPPVGVIRGKGAWLIDENGNKILDAVSSWWVNIHGHAEPHIARAIAAQAKQLEQVIFAGFTHEPAVRLAERLLKKLPGDFTRIFFSDNGSTAVEAALKMALQYHFNKGASRAAIIAFSHSYHGDTFGAMSASARSVFTQPFSGLLFDVIHIEPPLPGTERASLEQLKSVLKKQTAAAFIFEPLVMGAGGMLMYAPQPLDEMLALCRKHNVITIADEVMTGFGRTGKLFATEFLKNQPDIICLSKGITGGFLPLGVTAVTETIYRAFLSCDSSKTFFHGHSYTANPLACAAASASLDLIEKKTFRQDIRRIAARQLRFSKRLQQTAGAKNARVTGTLLAFEYEPAETASSVQHRTDGYLHGARARIYDFFMNKKILLRPLGNTIYLMPPYCITNAELDCVYDAIMDFLSEKF